MKGCRPLTDQEIEAIKQNLNLRNQTIFVLGLRTGFRVSELLSLDIKDVRFGEKINEYVRVWKRFMKGKKQSRTVPIHKDAVEMLSKYLSEEPGNPNDPLFRSVHGRLEKSVFHRQLKTACEKAGIENVSTVATHSMRKTFAKRFFDASGRDIYLTQTALGHSNIGVTIRYLQIDASELSNLILNLYKEKT